MEYTSASMSFSLMGANEAALHVPGGGPCAPGGGGSEEQPPSLDVSDYISIDEGSQLEEYSPAFAFTGECYQDPFLPAEDTGESNMGGRTSSSLKCAGGVQQQEIMEQGIVRYVFRTKSGWEALDDGYKWRKYGKKAVKSSPHRRHYYRCTAVGCCVKKRVERDREDDSYVLTTYEGNHSHPPPGEVYYPVPRVHDAAAASAAGAQRGPSGGSFYPPGDPAGDCSTQGPGKGPPDRDRLPEEKAAP